jgi:hypothetical protein
VSRALAPVAVLETILDAIGHTPLLRLRLAGLPAGVEVWGKCEWFNPGGSVKDRTALSLVTEGEKGGALRPATLRSAWPWSGARRDIRSSCTCRAA